MSRLFYGVVLSESVYVRFGHRLTHARTFLYNKFDEKTRERLWFYLSKSESYVVCKAPRNGSLGELEPFVKAGLLLDLRVMPEMDSASSLHDYIMRSTNSRGGYISKCHMIRNKLANEVDVPFRWNGAEIESLIHPTLISKASYFTGLADIGRFWKMDGTYISRDVNTSTELWIHEAYNEALELEPGQAKLYSLMMGMAMVRDIIYIGSSPGTGWQRCIQNISFNGSIYSFDPEPLDQSIGTTTNIVHIQKKVLTPSDIWTEVPPGAYDLIWDVRGETSAAYGNHEAIVSIIEEEIRILYSILECPITSKYLRRINIKVKWDMINMYRFPDHARLYFLPFCWRDDRPINELRAVFIMSSVSLLTHRHFDYATMRAHIIDNRVDDLTLFYNIFMMRLDPICFMENINNDVRLEVNLFCINWNDPAKIQRYLSRLLQSNIDILSSYFLKPSLRPGEFEVNESMLLSSHMQIFDSRLLISAKLEDLYFFTNKGSIRWYRHELVTAESFVIMDEEMRLRKHNIYDNYDSCRDDACRIRGGVFMKFPNVSSISDNLISPSGHSLRMTTAFLNGKVSLGMFILKILYSFYRIRGPWINYPSTPSVTKLFGITLNIVEGCGEPAVEKLWHSLQEWIIGIECGFTLMDKPIDRTYSAFLESVITAKTKIGIEVSTYYTDREIDYAKFMKKREQHVPFCDGTIQDLCWLFIDFRCDTVDFLLKFRIDIPEWQTLVMSLKLDKVLLEICLLRSMYLTISGTSSSTIFSELFSLGPLLAIARGRFPNDTEEGINLCDKALWTYPHFLRSYTRCDPISFLQLDRDLAVERLTWHLICDHWLTTLKFIRSVRSEELRQFKLPTLPYHVQMRIIRFSTSVLPDGEIFNIDLVKRHFTQITSIRV